MRAIFNFIGLPFGPLPKFLSIKVPFRVRWQILLIILGVVHAMGTLYDAMSTSPWLYTTDREQESFWVDIYTAEIRLFPGPQFAESLMFWPAFIRWNLSSSLGWIFLGSLHLTLPSSSYQDDPVVHTTLLYLAFITILTCALTALQFFSYLSALGLLLMAAGVWSDLRSLATQRVRPPIMPPRVSSARAMFFALGTIPILLSGVSHFLMATVHPILLVPMNRLLYRQLTEAKLAQPFFFGSTFWQAYLGININHGLSIVAISLSSIFVGNSRTLLRYPKVLRCLLGTGVTLAWISICCWFWVPTMAVFLFVICQLV